MAKFQSKNVILTKKINNVIYECFVKTNSNMVYTDEYTTLTETLEDVYNLLTEFKDNHNELEEEFGKLFGEDEHTFRSFKEVYDYVNINGDPKSALIKMIEGKQNAEEGKGLSTHDLDDMLYAKLKYGYSKEELDEKFKVVQTNTESIEKIAQEIKDIKEQPNIVVSDQMTNGIKDYSCWYQIVSIDGK